MVAGPRTMAMARTVRDVEQVPPQRAQLLSTQSRFAGLEGFDDLVDVKHAASPCAAGSVLKGRP